MKKYLSLILIFTVAFAMVSCGGDEPGKPDKPETEKPTEPETPGDLTNLMSPANLMNLPATAKFL